MGNMLGLNAWVHIMADIYVAGETYPARIAKNADITYSYTHHVVQELKKQRWITNERIGRQYVCRLTPKGKEIAELCNQILLKVKQ